MTTPVISYFDALKQGYPTVVAICNGNPFIYDSLEWQGGDALPSQDDLDTWIHDNPGWDPTQQLTKYQFRQLFTLNEKVAIDSAPTNTQIPAQYRAVIYSILKDLELSEVVHLDNPQVTSGLQLLVQLGLLTQLRKDQIMANTPAPV